MEAVTTSAASWSDPAMPSTATGFAIAWRARYILSSDQPFHISADETATTSATRIPANTLVEIELIFGQSLSYILASSATGNGSLYITKKS